MGCPAANALFYNHSPVAHQTPLCAPALTPQEAPMKLKLKTTKTIKLSTADLAKLLGLTGEVTICIDYTGQYNDQSIVGVSLTSTTEEEREV